MHFDDIKAERFELED